MLFDALALVLGFLLGMGTTFFLIALDKNVVVTKKSAAEAETQAQNGVKQRGTSGEARSIYGNPTPVEEYWDDEKI